MDKKRKLEGKEEKLKDEFWDRVELLKKSKKGIDGCERHGRM